MHLITMAHMGEAQAIIDKFHLVKISKDLFKNQEMLLLITGEGPTEAAVRTALTLPLYPVKEVLNLGIAGSLKNHPLNEIYPVRTIYLAHDLKPAFKTFEGSPEGLDCVTTNERILEPSKAQILQGLGQLVDREAWGVAMASKEAGVSFKCFKIISDVAGTLDACELVKDRALEFSDRLSSFLASYLEQTEKTSEVPLAPLPGFYFTFTAQHQLQKLLKKLSIKEEIDEESILQSSDLAGLRELKVTPKERAKLLIQNLEARLDPFKKALALEKLKLEQQFSKRDLKLHLDPQWENPKVGISFEAGSNEELAQKIEALKDVGLETFTRLMRGEFHVE